MAEDKEEYEKMRKHLKTLLNRRKALRRELDTTEESIYFEETSYLQDAVAGNIAKGFDHYTKTNQSRRRPPLTDEDRIFSQSSALFMEAEQPPP